MRRSALPSWLDPGTRKGLVGAAALLWVMTVVAYLPALGGGFVFDDRMYITEDSRMESAGVLVRIWTELQLDDVQHQYYPMTSSAFWVQPQLWGKHPFGYHLVNGANHPPGAFLGLRRGLRSWVIKAAQLGQDANAESGLPVFLHIQLFQARGLGELREAAHSIVDGLPILAVYQSGQVEVGGLTYLDSVGQFRKGLTGIPRYAQVGF